MVPVTPRVFFSPALGRRYDLISKNLPLSKATTIVLIPREYGKVIGVLRPLSGHYLDFSVSRMRILNPRCARCVLVVLSGYCCCSTRMMSKPNFATAQDARIGGLLNPPGWSRPSCPCPAKGHADMTACCCPHAINRRGGCSCLLSCLVVVSRERLMRTPHWMPVVPCIRHVVYRMQYVPSFQPTIFFIAPPVVLV